jgi:hypothetical protein
MYMVWARHVARVEEVLNLIGLFETFGVKILRRRSLYWWEDDIKKDLEDMGFKRLEWIRMFEVACHTFPIFHSFMFAHCS